MKISHHLCSATLLAVVLFAFSGSAWAQSSEQKVLPLPKNSLYVELGGNALIYSINYDRVLQDQYSLRVGMGFFGDGDFFLPILGNYLLGKGNSRLELGLGVSIISVTFGIFDNEENVSRVVGTGSFAYRFQKADGGIFGKAGFTPMFNDAGFLPWFGASIGYTLD